MITPYQASPATLLLGLLVTAGLLLSACESTISSNSRGKAAVGSWVATMPSGTKVKNVAGFTYYVSNGNYFVRKGDRFVAVNPPQSSLIEKEKLSDQYPVMR